MRPVGSKYLLDEPLGRGATGTVWRARVRESGAYVDVGVPSQPGETVAIKVLREELASDPDIVLRFLRERSVLLRLTHPNIVRVRDLVVEGDLLALVMDLVDGPDLHRYLGENGPFTPVAASLLMAQIADALAASHTDEVVHRDLKPANVLLVTSAGDGVQRMHPLLTDFGIARLADSPGITRTSEFVGTPAYVAPESAEGKPQTSAVDIYGAGILLYELVTGRPPFTGESAVAVLHQHVSEAPRRPGMVPEPLWTVIERCLRKDPDERPSAANLGRALRVVADGVGGHASAAAVEAAFGVGALLAPDPSPAAVPGSSTAAGSADPTLVVQSGPGSSESATQVLPTGGQGPDGGDATSVLPATAGAGHPQPSGDPPQQDGPHPWENQLRAARDRNEQTQVQYLDPNEDPLRRRPRRQAAAPPPALQGYADPRAPQGQQQPYQQQRGRAPARYTPPHPAPEPPAPRAHREPRPRSRARIPGLGCLRGCLTTIILLVIASWLVWELTPLKDWVAEGKGFWDATRTWVREAWRWFENASDLVDQVQQSGR